MSTEAELIDRGRTRRNLEPTALYKYGTTNERPTWYSPAPLRCRCRCKAAAVVFIQPLIFGDTLDNQGLWHSRVR